MVRLKRKLFNLAVRIYVNTTGSSLKQGENLAPAGGRLPEPGMSELLRQAAAEGAVLLKNDGVLPLSADEKIAVFGRVQTDSFYTGYGSGGDVIKPYRISILEGLEKSALSLDEEVKSFYVKFSEEHPADHGYWGNWPFSFPEAPLEEEFVRSSAARAKTAVVILGRAAGEDRDQEKIAGSYFLTEEEKRMLRLVTECFERTAVVLNVGSIFDFSFLEDEKINAALLIWQGGMETGGALPPLLTGEISPCGKLSASVARSYEDIPSASCFGGVRFNEYREDVYVGYRYFETFAKDKVLYPFGFGLSYTDFSIEAEADGTKIGFCVKNIGERKGKEVVEVYASKPSGGMGNPARELIGFYKTKELSPGEEESGEILFSERSFCSYDEEKSAYVMLAGEYRIFAGEDVRSASLAGKFVLEEEKICERLCEQCAPEVSFEKLGAGGTIEFPRLKKKDLRREMLSSLPAAYEKPSGGKIRLKDVKAGRADLREFTARLSLQELEAISRGDYTMDSPLGARGNAGVFGGVLPSLRGKGVPPITATDGPSGIRLKESSSLLPIGTLLACTFDEKLVEKVYAAVGREMKERESDVLLAPAMNIQRNPLAGRNFEYFSEDPFLTGKIASAVVRGVQSEGVSACPKHFACNNQEFNRSGNDSRVSERALREIYLRGFEICVKEGKPDVLMTSYNLINGVWAHYHFELVRGILRGEWGFEGCVITDWWMKRAACPQFKSLKTNAYRVRAGINVLMPGGGHLGRRKSDGTLLKTLGKKEGITLGELQRNAEEILRFAMKSSAFERFEREESEKRHR